LAPWKIIPKDDGQATVASRELQCAQRVASVEVAAPQLGQLSVCAAITGGIFRFSGNSASSD